MLKITQLKIECSTDATRDEKLLKKVSKLCRLPMESLKISVLKHSLDARKKPQLFDIYTVCVNTGLSAEKEERLIAKLHSNDISIYKPSTYQFPKTMATTPIGHRPVIVGAGPAGLFCALYLAEQGYCPIVIERGKTAEQRQKDIDCYFESGKLNPESNVQFGEGGAGTFSDGKLNTLVKDKMGRTEEILKRFVEFGAPEDILYEAKPHIGTDYLIHVVSSMRERIIALGGTFLFETKFVGLIQNSGSLCGIRILSMADGSEKEIETKTVILSLGHSARDTMTMLYDEKLPMEAKDYALGFRVMHPQTMINQDQYGVSEEVRKKYGLPAAPYKLTARSKSGRGVYSFCMCPGGYVVNASSEPNRLAVNGMSYHKRDSAYANAAIVLQVPMSEIPGDDCLRGMRYQQSLEERCFAIGKGEIPVEKYLDFKQEVEENHSHKVITNEEIAKLDEQNLSDLPEHLAIKGGYRKGPLHHLFPASMNQDFIEGMEAFSRQIKGYAGENAILCGLESRTSSPIRMPRDEHMESAIKGIFPCGEGAGYAGGIMSAAMDGMKIAEEISKRYLPSSK